ncbi:uncharacterized protein LOC120138173 [Hibiscus syriacus]|uniref:uncharacterized protein LOC120138173 n=1 Tax=Hibiscus syriacus TaxID=106335 RepID=UPI0019231E74|nr:uncharacterized protein LOC120138173 [Hibiscus syriacus]
MKKLLCEEMSKQYNSRHNSPSIVARLMGMDLLPSDIKSVAQLVTKKSDNRRVELSGREKNVKGSNSYFLKQMEVDSVYSTRDRDAEIWNTDLKFRKPRHREHPQEEELQRFKKEFEAWQVPGLGNVQRLLMLEAFQIINSLESNRTTKGRHIMWIQYKRCMRSFWNPRGLRSINKDFCVPSTTDYNEKSDAAPTRIVILKPGPDGIYDHEESWTSSPSTFQERASMEDFLEEVRERLKSELQGKTLN